MFWLAICLVVAFAYIAFRQGGEIEKLENWCGYLESEIEDLRSQRS